MSLLKGQGGDAGVASPAGHRDEREKVYMHARQMRENVVFLLRAEETRGRPFP